MRRKYSTIILSALLIAISGFPAFSVSADSSQGWGTPICIETENLGDADNPQIAIDDNGNTIAVWRQYDGFFQNVLANRYEIGKGWLGAEVIEDNDGDTSGMRVAMDGAGNAVAVWYQFNQTTLVNNVWANRYEIGIGWGDSFLLETDDSGYAISPDIAADSNGNFIAVWSQFNGSLYDLMASRYEIGVGWGSVTSIETNNTADAKRPRIEFDDNRNAVVVWAQELGFQTTIWSNRYEIGTGWGTPEQIGDFGLFGQPELTIDRNGNVTCTWNHMNVYYEIWGNHYEVGSGWETDTLLKANPLANEYDPNVASDGNGKATVVWYEGVRPNNIWAIDYESGAGWGPATIIVYPPDGDVGVPRITMNEKGDAIVVFLHNYNFIQTIWTIQYEVGIGWGVPEKISSDGYGNIQNLQISMNERGNAIAIWTQNDGFRNNIWANDFTPADTTPPILSINEPSEGEIFETSVITISGTTEPGVTLNVNGALAAVEEDGSFSLEIALLEGNNAITATATDAAGNPTTKSLTVTYNPPTTSIEDELNATQEELEAALDDLEATKDELNATSGDVADLKSQSLIFIAILAVIVILCVIMSVMYLSLRKKIGDIGPKQGERETPPPSN